MTMRLFQRLSRSIDNLARRLSGRAPCRPFAGSDAYWRQRYDAGGNSGSGSYGRLALFKAEVLNEFVRAHQVKSVIEHGCGDGNQLSLVHYPSYIGVDISPAAISACRERFAGDPTRRFQLPTEPAPGRPELALSLDVIYHLIEDETFERYMRALFASAERWVIIYSSNYDSEPGSTPPHVRHRRFSAWIDANARDWALLRQIPNRYPGPGDRETSFADFYIYERRAQ